MEKYRGPDWIEEKPSVEKKRIILITVGLIVIVLIFLLGIRVGKKARKGWEAIDPKDRFVEYYIQKGKLNYVVVRDDVKGDEYLVIFRRGALSIVPIPKHILGTGNKGKKE